MKPPAGGVERQLADGNGHAAGSLVAKSQDALAVSDHNRFDIVEVCMAQDARDSVFVGDAEEKAALFESSG